MTYKVTMDAAFGGDAAASKQLAAVIQRCAGIGASRADATEFADDVGQELWMFTRQHADRFDPQYELEPYLIETAFRTAQAMRRRNLSLGTLRGNDERDDAPPDGEAPAGMDGAALQDGSAADGDVVDQVDSAAALNYLLRISPELRGINDGSIKMSDTGKHSKTSHAPPAGGDDVADMKAMVNRQAQSIDALTRMFAQLMQAQGQPAKPQEPAPQAASPTPAPAPRETTAGNLAEDPVDYEAGREADAEGRASLVGTGDDDAGETEGAALPSEEPAMMAPRKYGRATSEKAALLKTLRQAGGLTQVEMAERLGLKVPTYQSYEYGRSGIPAHVLEAAKKVSVTPEYTFIRSRYFGKTMTEIAREWCKRLRIAPPSPTRLAHIMMVNKGTASRWLDPTVTVKMTPPELLQYEHRVQAEEEFLKVAAERHGTDVVDEGMRRVVAMDEARQRRAEAEAMAKRAAEIEAELEKVDKPRKR